MGRVVMVVQEISGMKKSVPETKWHFLGILFIFLAFMIASAGAIFMFTKIQIPGIILLSLAILLASTGIILLLIAKGLQNTHLKERRDQIRKYVTEVNFNSFHMDGKHWTVSPRASYLILRLRPLSQQQYNSNVTIDYAVSQMMGDDDRQVYLKNSNVQGGYPNQAQQKQFYNQDDRIQSPTQFYQDQRPLQNNPPYNPQYDVITQLEPDNHQFSPRDNDNNMPARPERYHSNNPVSIKNQKPIKDFYEDESMLPNSFEAHKPVNKNPKAILDLSKVYYSDDNNNDAPIPVNYGNNKPVQNKRYGNAPNSKRQPLQPIYNNNIEYANTNTVFSRQATTNPYYSGGTNGQDGFNFGSNASSGLEFNPYQGNYKPESKQIVSQRNRPYNLQKNQNDNPFGTTVDIQIDDSADSQIDLEINGYKNRPLKVNITKSPRRDYDYASGNFRSGNTPFR